MKKVWLENSLSQLTQAILELNLFLCKYFNILKPSYSWCLSAYEDGTECSETSTYKIHPPGNYPEKSIQMLVILAICIPV